MGINILNKSLFVSLLLVPALFLTISLAADEGKYDMKTYFLLDDFSTENSTLKTEWKGFTDRVMGGVSEMSINRVRDTEGNFIRMRGKVSLKNNGGFIQIRLKLRNSLTPFDGSAYEGIRLVVRGTGSGYYIFLRTTATILPWKYYAAPVKVSGEWQVVDIPWTSFLPGNYGNVRKLKINKLKSLALVAYGQAFNASIDLKEIGLYGKD